MQNFSQTLKAALDLDTPEIQRIWRIQEAGWMDGGCFCLALALHKWCEELVPVGVFCLEHEVFHHAAVVLTDTGGRRWVVDGAGITEEAGFADRYRADEGIGSALVCREIDLTRLSGAAYADEIFEVEGLTQHLGQCLGAPKDWKHLIAPPGGPGQRKAVTSRNPCSPGPACD